MVTSLKPLDREFGIKRVDVSTYKAVSGAGGKAMEELTNQMRDLMNFQFDDTKTEVFPHKIALNAIPQIDKFMDNDYTKEEVKMIEETRKIMHKDIAVSATCIRIPVLRGHSESVTITFEKEVDANIAREILSKSQNIIVVDNPAELKYPMPLDSSGRDEVFIGRIRSDVYDKTILHLWVVADNLRVGAATNSVRIAQKWIEMESE
jgi:aspartate-semialdehyde dehydrogenase